MERLSGSIVENIRRAMADGVCHCWAASKKIFDVWVSLTDRHHLLSLGPYYSLFPSQTCALSTELQ
jgi:hypothetical protein